MLLSDCCSNEDYDFMIIIKITTKTLDTLFFAFLLLDSMDGNKHIFIRECLHISTDFPKKLLPQSYCQGI